MGGRRTVRGPVLNILEKLHGDISEQWYPNCPKWLPMTGFTYSASR